MDADFDLQNPRSFRRKMESSSWQLVSGKTELLALSHIEDQLQHSRLAGSPRQPSSLGALTAQDLSLLRIQDSLPSGIWVFVSSVSCVGNVVKVKFKDWSVYYDVIEETVESGGWDMKRRSLKEDQPHKNSTPRSRRRDEDGQKKHCQGRRAGSRLKEEKTREVRVGMLVRG